MKAKTAGRVNFVLYPSGQLGNEKTMVEGMQIGSQGARFAIPRAQQLALALAHVDGEFGFG